MGEKARFAMARRWVDALVLASFFLTLLFARQEARTSPTPLCPF